MLYLIIPPAIIIASLALLIFLLSRKISNFSDEESEQLVRESRELKAIKRLKKFSFSKISNFTLKFLELVTQWFKITFLKFYNISDKWFRSIKEKKNKNDLKPTHKNFLKKQPVKRFLSHGFPVKKINKIKEIKIAGKRENRPMLSREVAQPEYFGYRSVTKDKLEEMLIERIAVNPRDLEAYERLGDYYIERQNFKDALECYRQVLKLSPVNYKAKIKTRKLEKILNSQL